MTDFSRALQVQGRIQGKPCAWARLESATISLKREKLVKEKGSLQGLKKNIFDISAKFLWPFFHSSKYDPVQLIDSLRLLYCKYNCTSPIVNRAGND